jgi:large conductance mechanosensitive channel
MFKEFREFILKGNAIDLAVGVLIGAAFGGFVKAFTEGIITPLIRLAGGDVEVALKLGIFDVGIVINAAVNLLITGIILFFIFVRPMNKLKAWNAPPVTPPPPPPEVALLTEIRDLLKQDKKP